MYNNSTQSGGSRPRRGSRPMYSSRSNNGRNNRTRGPKPIDPRKFINQAIEPKAEVAFVPKHVFADFGFDQRLQENIDNHGYVNPTPIQDGAIPFVIEGRDLIGLANTGTGKTAAFLLPLLHRHLKKEVTRTLIMVPTRELAVQIEEEFKIFARGLSLFSTLIVGGASMNRQLNQLQRHPQFIIGTPGRLKDLIENYGLRLEEFDSLVLDEADRMLDMGFIKDIKTILGHMKPNKQTLFLSATITSEIDNLIAELLHNPETVSVRKGETAAHVEQNIVEVEGRDQKENKIVELLNDPEFSKVLIFAETKHGVQKLSDNLNRIGLRTQAIHGNKSQPQRQRALQDFKLERVQALIATDVAARGLDIPNVTHVINFDIPNNYEDYVHRIGRTGRAGKKGNALTFVPRQARY